MKKLFLWILIFIQPLLIAIATGLFCRRLYMFITGIDGSGDGGNLIAYVFIWTTIIGLIPGIVLSIFIYKKHLSSKHFED